MNGALRLIVVILSAFGIATATVPWCRRLALAVDLVDRPCHRKVHSTPTPFLGGLAVATAVLVSLGATGGFTPKTRWILLCGAGVAAIGLLDDESSMSPKLRLLLESILAGVVVVTGTRLSLTGIVVVDSLCSALLIVSVTNALNFCDNMDGLAAGLSFAGAVSLLASALLVGSGQLALVGGAVAGAVLGFVVYNGPPASIFLGDSGSLFLGFVFASLAVSVSHAIDPLRGALAVALALGVVLLDLGTVVVARRRNGISIARAGRDHLSHRLAAAGLSRPRAAGILVGVACLLGVIASLVASSQIGPWSGTVAAMLLVAPCLWVAWRTPVYAPPAVPVDGDDEPTTEPEPEPAEPRPRLVG